VGGFEVADICLFWGWGWGGCGEGSMSWCLVPLDGCPRKEARPNLDHLVHL
jgi:hypothetical protein